MKLANNVDPSPYQFLSALGFTFALADIRNRIQNRIHVAVYVG